LTLARTARYAYRLAARRRQGVKGPSAIKQGGGTKSTVDRASDNNPDSPASQWMAIAAARTMTHRQM
jgi:hypothetical protein